MAMVKRVEEAARIVDRLVAHQDGIEARMGGRCLQGVVLPVEEHMYRVRQCQRVELKTPER